MAGRLNVSIPMHPSLLAAYNDYCQPFFMKKILTSEAEGGFEILKDEAGQTKLLDMLADDTVKEAVAAHWARHPEYT